MVPVLLPPSRPLSILLSHTLFFWATARYAGHRRKARRQPMACYQLRDVNWRHRSFIRSSPYLRRKPKGEVRPQVLTHREDECHGMPTRDAILLVSEAGTCSSL